MEKLKLTSTHWRATCSFEVFGVDYRDYLRFKLSAFDPLCCYVYGSPKLVELVNIRGHIAKDQLVNIVQVEKAHIHIDSHDNACFSQASEGSVGTEDNFGFYYATNSAFRCTAKSSSTTQHWMGIYYP